MANRPGDGGGLRLGVDAHPAHHVVAGGPDLHRPGRDVDAGQLHELVVHRREPAPDVLGRATRRDVEVDAAVRGAATRLDLGVDGAGHLVAGQEVGRAPVVDVVVVPGVGFLFGLRRLGPEHVGHVVEHEALALGVAQHAAVAAHALGDEDAAHRERPDHAGRVELHAFHVDDVGPGPDGHGVAVTDGLPRVRGVLPRLADGAGGEDEGLGGEEHHLAGRPPVAHGARDPALGVVQQAQDLGLHEDVGAHGDDLLLERADELQAGAVADVGQAGVAVAAEVALGDAPVLGAVEERAPALQLVDPVGGLHGVDLRHAPVVQHLAAAHGVAEVDLPVVLGPHVAHGGGHAALGHDRVRLAEQRLADERDPQAALLGLDGGPQPGAAGADDDDVVVVGLVVGRRMRFARPRSGSRGRGWCRSPPGARRGRTGPHRRG